MTSNQGFELHPGAVQDITEIWEFIAADNPQAAARVREEILTAIRNPQRVPHQGHTRTDFTHVLFDFSRFATISSFTHRMNPRCS